MDSSTHPSRRSAGFQHTYESFEIFPEEAQIKPRSRRVDILNPLRAVISESDFQFFERFGPALKKKKKKKNWSCFGVYGGQSANVYFESYDTTLDNLAIGEAVKTGAVGTIMGQWQWQKGVNRGKNH